MNDIYMEGKRKRDFMKNILIVVDMQNDFVDGVLGSEEAVSAAGRAAVKIREFDGKIFVTLDTHSADYLDTPEGRKLPTPHCIRLTDGWLLNGEVFGALAGKDYETVEKDAFASTKLVEKIRGIKGEEGIKIELIGLCTDICVVSNALLLKAHFPDAEICVDADCCAGVTLKTHQAALDTMRMCQIDILKADGGNPASVSHK